MAPEKNKKGEKAAAEGSSKPLSSEKGTPKSLKPESKIAKKFRGKKFVNTKKGQGNPQEKGTPQSQGRQEKGTPQSQGRPEKGTPQSEGKRRRNRRRTGAQGKKDGNENEKEGAEKPSLKEGNKEKNIKDEKLIEKKEHNQKEKEKLGGLKKPENNQENGEKHGRMDNRQQYQNNNKERHGKSVQNERNKEKVGRSERSQENEKGKVDGLIFMCSAKTKPDCFRHRVMGVPMSKKDVVLGIKPGLKLFLYDFELKLMYGIYKAASSGGLKLEPTAFGGAFPAQVRFDVYKDCYPLPESVFKKAIIQNYNKNHKFDTELTFQQVKKLMDLFKPANTLSNAPPPILYPPVPGYEGGRDFYSNGETKSCEMAKEETFLTEKEYRRFGLRGERQSLIPYPDPIYRETAPAPALTPSQREPVSVRHDPILLSEEEYRTYGLGGARRDPPPTVTTETYPKDLYYAYNYGGSGVGGGSSGDPYLPGSSGDLYLPGSSGSYSLGGRRESYVTAATEPEHLRRREDVLYSTYATNALSDYNQMYQQTTQGMTRPEPALASQMYQQTTQGMTRPELALVPQMYQQTQEMTRPEPALAPVSARYSFAGPSSTYR